MITFVLFVLGLCIGSFANAMVWRLHKGRNLSTDRSECETCHHKLGPHDLVPVLSWVVLRGRCRYCKTRLSRLHPVVELATGGLFALSYLAWPMSLAGFWEITIFGLWLAYLGGIVILFLYDLRWKLLPNKVVFPLIFLAAVQVLAQIALSGIGELWGAIGGAVLIAGFFGGLYAISGGRWIGFGDVKLGVFMGLALGLPASILALVGSYYIAAIIVVPLLLARKVTPKSQVPFGPFLLIAFVIAGLWGERIAEWYRSLLVL